MTSPSRPIESWLHDLMDQIAWPEHPDLAPRVRARLTKSDPPGRRVRWLSVTAAVLVVVAVTLVLSSAAREAVADLLGVAGIEVLFDGRVEPTLGAGLDLGEPMTLEEATSAVEFELSLPEGAGPPDAVYLSSRPSGGRVSMVWERDASLPAAAGSDIGLIYSQFALNLGEDQVFVKSVRPENLVGSVDVNGVLGVWIEGAPHVITYRDAAEQTHQEETRLAGNVLMWERAGVTHRIETTQTLEEALRLARSITTMP